MESNRKAADQLRMLQTDTQNDGRSGSRFLPVRLIGFRTGILVNLRFDLAVGDQLVSEGK